MDYIIGIDGGGTKTQCLVADENGFILASSVGGSTNPNVINSTILQETFKTLLDDLNQQLDNDVYNHVTHLFAGISGAGMVMNQNEIKRILTELLPASVSIEVYPDPINALYSGTFGKPGIVQIAGTGSITYGINENLEHDRVGGWGYLFGDEGSGYDLGKQGIIAALKAFDGRGKETILEEMLYDSFKVKDGHELVSKIYTSPFPKHEVAPISRIVMKAYEYNDAVAQKIVTDAVGEISTSILTLYNKLLKNGESVKVVLCGGVFTNKNVLPPLILKELTRYNSFFSIVIPDFPPVGGSLIGAYLSKGHRVNRELVKTISDSYHVINKGSR
ncbi:N-acetylglucosamine kinase [Virgibacillus sp. DJP39]|uniref:N-acetylglucosamine kinase n=1 Tax=Virgibacillus sp. DJP39 TaxID=3409790 RepID=UPI003BB54ADF